MDNSEGSIEFKIKSEELFIKDEVYDSAYELPTTEENTYFSEDQRQFVIVKSDIGPPHHILDRVANIMIKVDSSIYSTEDLNKILTCYVGLFNLPENVSSFKMEINSEKQDVNEPSNYSAIHDREKHKFGTSERISYKCQKCQKQFTRKYGLTVHMLIHKGKRPYKCKECQKEFNDKSNLRRHMLIHEGKKLYKCQKCLKEFTLKCNLKMHLLIHDRKHMLIHEGKRPHKCRECQKGFTRKDNLKQHLLIHEGKRPYKCQKCKKQFTHKNYLRMHTLIHEGKRPYECQKCPKRFFRKYHLRRHMLIHDDKRPHKCQEF